MSFLHIQTALMVFFLLGPLACFSNNEQAASEVEEVETTEEDGESEELGESDSTYDHPSAPTMWATKALIAATKFENESRVIQCLESIRSRNNPNRNPEDLLTMTKDFDESVKETPEAYHWCFYRSVGELDRYLGENHSFSEKSSQFVLSMEVLWSLARSLDDHLEEQTYFTYLRERYIQLSGDYFGRHLDVMTRPLGERRTKEGDEIQKAAAEAEVE